MRSISDLIHQAVGQAVGQAVADTYVIILATEFSSAESLQKFLKDRGEPITVELLIDKGILEGDPLSIVLAVELLGSAVPAWKRPRLRTLGPSGPIKYQQLEVAAALPKDAEDCSTEATVYTLRPFATLPAVAPPARFIFPGFGFITAAAEQQGPLDRDLPDVWYEKVQNLVHASGRIYKAESQRQDAISMELKDLWPDLSFTKRCNHDGSLVVAGLNDKDYLVCLVEFKNELYSSGDPELQCVRYIQEMYFNAHGKSRWLIDPVLQATGAPVLILTIAGPQWNIYGAYSVRENAVVCDPIISRPFNLLQVHHRDPSLLPSLVHTLAACYIVIKWLKQFYEALKPASPLPLTAAENQATLKRERAELNALVAGLSCFDDSYSQLLAASCLTPQDIDTAADWRACLRHPLPYPLLYPSLGSRYTNVKPLDLTGALMFKGHCSLPQYTGPVIVKITASQYPEEIHRAWADAGVAVKLVEQLPWCGHMVVMEDLCKEDDWEMLPKVPKEQHEAALAAAMAALAHAHAIQVTCSNGTVGVAVRGDARGPNTMARQQEDGTWDIKFIDFDWAGIHAVDRYPALVRITGGWHEGARAGKLMWQEHDKFLLKEQGLTGVPSLPPN